MSDIAAKQMQQQTKDIYSIWEWPTSYIQPQYIIPTSRFVPQYQKWMSIADVGYTQLDPAHCCKFTKNSVSSLLAGGYQAGILLDPQVFVPDDYTIEFDADVPGKSMIVKYVKFQDGTIMYGSSKQTQDIAEGHNIHQFNVQSPDIVVSWQFRPNVNNTWMIVKNIKLY